MLFSHTDIPTEPFCLKNRPFPFVVQSLQGLGIARPKIVTQRTYARSLHQGHQGHGHRSEVREDEVALTTAGWVCVASQVHPPPCLCCCCLLLRVHNTRSA